jgi:hypothetical protein
MPALERMTKWAAARLVSRRTYPRHVPTCSGSLIVHADGTIAGCTEDDEQEGCRGRELRHDGDTVRCWVWPLLGLDAGGLRLLRRPVERRTFPAAPLSS